MKYAFVVAALTTATLTAQAVPDPPQGRGRGGAPPVRPEPLAMADHAGFESIFDGSSMKGYQADIDADNQYTGQIYEERGRAWWSTRT